MNHVTPDGLLAVDQCKREMRYRDRNLVLQDTCTPEPGADLVISTVQGDDGSGSASLTLTVSQITHLRDALNEWLQDHKPRIGWMHKGVIYDMDAAWWGRGVYHGLLFRHTGEWRDGVPLMQVVPPHPEYTEVITLIEARSL